MFKKRSDRTPGRCVCCGKLVKHFWQIAETYEPLLPTDVCMCRNCMKYRRPKLAAQVNREMGLAFAEQLELVLC